MKINIDDLTNPKIEPFLQEHMADMLSISPPESVHALDLAELKHPSVTFWTAWDAGELVGCGALKIIESGHGEIKSMRVAQAQRGKGISKALMQVILEYSQQQNLIRLSLETGSPDFFKPARELYRRFGFDNCGPFGHYQLDPESVFMTKLL